MMSAHERPAMETVLPDEKHQIPCSHPCRKILFVSKTHEYGGAEKDLIELIRRLCGPRLQVSILCLGTDFFSKRLNSNLGVDITTCNRMPDSIWDWLRVLRVSQPDVVVFVYGWSDSFRWTASIGARLAGIRRRFSIQQLVSPERNTNRHPVRRVLRWLVGSLHLKISASLFHTTICVSDAMRDSLIKDFGFPAKKMKTIHNGVSLTQFVPSESNGLAIRAKLGIDRDEFLLVCAARLSDQKGIDILLQAMAQVLREGVRCKGVIVGDGPLRDQLLKQARGLSLCGHVFFEGFREDVRPYLQASSAFILTSHWEGLPLSILEAMACGLPSIVTDVGGNAEAITHQIHGLVVPPGSVGAVADAISYLATHPHERAQMSKMARARACEAFDIEKRMAEIKRVILS
jgi:glycosyltransferase involved in cell wall biosynthesis